MYEAGGSVTLNFNTSMSTADVFLDIEKAFETICHSGLLYNISEFEFLTSLINIIVSFLTDRKFEILVEHEFSTLRNTEAGVPRSSVLALILYSLYINDTPKAPETHLALLGDDTCSYATEKHERNVLR
jgi:hypothetical protein